MSHQDFNHVPFTCTPRIGTASERDGADAQSGRSPIQRAPEIARHGRADGGSYVASQQHKGEEFRKEFRQNRPCRNLMLTRGAGSRNASRLRREGETDILPLVSRVLKVRRTNDFGEP